MVTTIEEATEVAYDPSVRDGDGLDREVQPELVLLCKDASVTLFALANAI